MICPGRHGGGFEQTEGRIIMISKSWLTSLVAATAITGVVSLGMETSYARPSPRAAFGAVAGLALHAGSFGPADTVPTPPSKAVHAIRTPSPIGTLAASTAPVTCSMNGAIQQCGIEYWGGHNMGSVTPVVHPIWYGNWPTGSTTKSIVTTFLANLGGTPWMKVLSTYRDKYGASPTGALTLGSSYSISDPNPRVLSDNDIQNIVDKAITSGAFTRDSNSIYIVFTAPGFGETAWDGSKFNVVGGFCGWHSANIATSPVTKYIFIGDPSVGVRVIHRGSVQVIPQLVPVPF
jgi:hypothetical protein